MSRFLKRPIIIVILLIVVVASLGFVWRIFDVVNHINGQYSNMDTEKMNQQPKENATYVNDSTFKGYTIRLTCKEPLGYLHFDLASENTYKDLWDRKLLWVLRDTSGKIYNKQYGTNAVDGSGLYIDDTKDESYVPKCDDFAWEHIHDFVRLSIRFRHIQFPLCSQGIAWRDDDKVVVDYVIFNKAGDILAKTFSTNGDSYEKFPGQDPHNPKEFYQSPVKTSLTQEQLENRLREYMPGFLKQNHIFFEVGIMDSSPSGACERILDHDMYTVMILVDNLDISKLQYTGAVSWVDPHKVNRSSRSWEEPASDAYLLRQQEAIYSFSDDIRANPNSFELK